VIVPLIALTVRGIENLEILAGAPTGPTATGGGRMIVGVALISAFGLVNFFPWRATDKYFHFWGMRPDVRQLAQDDDFGRSLVLVQGNSHPDYASAATYNPIDVYSDDTVYAWDRNSEVRQSLLVAYADRPVWIVQGPSITGLGYQVIAGPISSQDPWLTMPGGQ